MKATSILLSVVIVVLAACSSGRMGATSGGPSADSARPNETTASAVQVPPTSLEEVGFISEHYTLPRGYLDPEALPDSLALLPPPPADGTAAKAADQEAFKQAMQAPDKRWELAAVDAERMKRLFPIKAILEAGGNVSLGSDFPAAAYVADYKPLNAITQAVTRQMLSEPDMPILGREDMRLTVAQAIRANTWGAAYGTGVEDEIGSLEAGKKADLIVIDQNLFEIDPHDVHKAKVLLTIMDGVVRHRDGM